jgi:predicted DNA-binding transcriptional regulator AlpA
VAKRVDPAALIDAHEAARILGLSRSTSIAVYRKRYEDFPLPRLDLGVGRPALWLRADIVEWARKTGRSK